MLRSWFLHFVFPILLIVQLCSSQSINLQNIETFYPVSVPPPVPTSPISPTPALSQSPPPTNTPTPTPPASSKSDVAKAVAATAASTLVFAVIFFFALQRYCLSKRLKQRQSGEVEPNPYADPPMPVAMRREFARVDGGIKGLIVDENGLDVLYWRKLEERNGNGNGQKNGYVKEVLEKKQSHGEAETRRDRSKRREPIQEVPLLREKSSASYDFKRVQPEIQDKFQIQSVSVAPARPSSVSAAEVELKAVGKQVSRPLPPPPGAVTAPRPPPPPVSKAPAPPPPPPVNKTSAPPPPPPIPGNKKGTAPPPPPPRKATGSKPPPGPPTKEDEVNDQVKLKPLHWDKVNTNTDHSMVWNKLDKGSFKFDGDLMEALFGSVAANRSPQNTSNKPAPSSSQITILDPRKSQNIAIVIKPLGISRSTLINSLKQGQGLDVEAIERLTRIAPTKDEESTILSFAGDPARLSDGESFLYHVLKSVPSAFSRLNAMHFRSQYASEIAHLKESLQTLELGCNELRTRGLFMKLLEAILKAGNRMNAGTARGNAQAFHLAALRKLSDVKSTDGKTTLLHFVVEEVVRAEGKRCILNRNRSLNRNNSLGSSETSKEEKEKQYTMLGLPVVGGLSSEFTNVKKSAGIDSDNFAGTCSVLSTRVSGFQRLVPNWDSDGVGGGFVDVMKAFLDDAEEELKVVGGEQKRVMELVKRTTEYYQAGASKDRGAAPLQLFVIVKDFLSMVDQVCVEIARNSQKKKPVTASSVSSSANSPATRTTVKFPILPKHFMSEKSYSGSSDSDNE